MKQIIDEYNAYYGTAWSLDGLDRYNGDINNRLARKKAEFKQFSKQIDLVILKMTYYYPHNQIIIIFRSDNNNS